MKKVLLIFISVILFFALTSCDENISLTTDNLITTGLATESPTTLNPTEKPTLQPTEKPTEKPSATLIETSTSQVTTTIPTTTTATTTPTTEAPRMITILFNTMGGSQINPLELLATSSNISLPIPTKENSQFVGWYTSMNFMEEFVFSFSLDSHVTVYALWQEASYTITYDTRGGSSVNTQTYAYLNVLVEPSEPSRLDHVFAGWYLDIDLTNEFIFSLMPNMNLVLYAKWVETTNPSMIVNQVNQAEGSSINVEGVIYGKMKDGVIGFFIYDVSGYLSISHTHSDLALGDKVKVIGTLSFVNNIPRVDSVTEVTVLSSDQALPPTKAFNFTKVNQLTNSDYLKIYQAEGLLLEDGGDYILLDPFTMNTLVLNPDTYTSIAGFASNIGNKIELKFILNPTDDGPSACILEHTLTVLTNVDKTSLLETIIQAKLNLVFSPGDSIQLNQFNPFFMTVISFTVPTEFDAYFDQDKNMFLNTEEDIIIPMTVSLNIGGDINSFVLSALLQPMSLSTVGALVDDTSMSLHNLKVMVISKTDETMLLKDASGYFYAFNIPSVNIGDEILIKARNDNDHAFTYLDYVDGDLQVILILSSENDLDLSISIYSSQDILALDKLDKTIYGEYIELRGFITMMDRDDFFGFSLVTDDYQIEISTVSHSGFERLFEYLQLEVHIRGFLYANELGEVTLYYEGIRGDIYLPEYTDLERVDLLSKLINDYLLKATFDSFESFDLSPYHALLGGNITWEFDDPNFAYFDFLEEKFLYSFDDQAFTLVITISSGPATQTIELASQLNKSLVTDFENLINYQDAFIQGTVIYHHDGYIYLMNDSGKIILVNMPESNIYTGDKVLVYGQLKTDSIYGGYQYFDEIEDQALLVKIISRNNPVVIAKNTMTIGRLSEIEGPLDLLNNIYVEIVGRLLMDENGIVTLETVDGLIVLEFPYEQAKIELIQNINEYVKISGFIKGPKYNYSIGESSWHILYVGEPGNAEVLHFTSQEKFNIIQDYIMQHYQVSVLSDTSFDFLLAKDIFSEVSITYTILDDLNTLLIVNPNGIIDIGSVILATPLTIQVNLDYLGDLDEFTFIFTVKPHPTIIVEKISDLVTDGLTPEYIQAVVQISVQYSTNQHLFIVEDSSGLMYIFVDRDLYLNNQYFSQDYFFGNEIRFFGTSSIVNGHKEMMATQMEVITRDVTNSVTFTEKTFEELYLLDLSTNENLGLPVLVSGTLVQVWEDGVISYYLEKDNTRIEIIEEVNNGLNLYAYKDLRISMCAFVYYDKGELKLLYQEQVYLMNDSIAVGPYSDQEIVDMIKASIDEFINSYNPIYNPWEYMYYPAFNPKIVEVYNPFVDYDIISGGDYVNESGTYLYSLLAPNDFEVVIEATIVVGMVVERVYFTRYINGFIIQTLDDLFDITLAGTQEIALEGTVIHSETNMNYILIENQIYKIQAFMFGMYAPGDKVIIIGQKSIIMGLADYTYGVQLLDKEESEPLDISSVNTTIAELYLNDYLLNPIQHQAHTIYGYLGYDKHLDLYTLTDNDKMVYVRILRDGWSDTDLLENLIGDYVYLDVLLSMDILRNEFMLVDLYDQSTGIQLKDYGVEESLALIKERLIELGDIHVYSGGKLDMYLPDSYEHHPNISIYYSLIDLNDLDYLDISNSIFNLVTSDKEIQMTATIIYTDEFSTSTQVQTRITIIIHPQADSTIREVIYGDDETLYQTTGIIVAFGPNRTYAIIQDESGRILVRLNDLITNTFNGLIIALDIGDQIKIIGERTYYDETNTIPMLNNPRAVEIISSNNSLVNQASGISVEEVFALPYTIITNNYSYVEVTGKFSAYYLPGSSISKYGLTIELGSRPMNQYYEHLRVYIQVQDSNLDLDDLNGLQVTIKGYLLGYNTLDAYGYPIWVMTYESHELVPIPV